MREYSIYIHIPFCVSKCIYCDFNSYANKEDKICEYIKSIINQIHNDNTFSKDDICKTIYIGGGTPSYINSKYIVQILKCIYGKYRVDKNAEITIEQNPCSMTKDKLKDYYDIGINRLSMGLQSTNNDLLKILARKHTYEEFLYKYELARSIGFNNINVDLMLALPNQTLENVKKDIQKIIHLQPEHISCYSLIIYENTPMDSLIKNKRYVLPSDDVERKMYYLVTNMLRDNGYNQYEISNFSKKNMESKHNLMCWNQYEYIGLGAGAHSFVDGVRFQNVDDLEQYIDSNKVIILEKMNNLELMNEFMILGMRLINGINSARFKQIYNQDMFEVFNSQISFLKNEGFIDIANNQIILTTKGIDYNNVICQQFI